MSIVQIVLNVSGGIVRDVFVSDARVQVILVDWDTNTSSDDDHGIVMLIGVHGHVRRAHVAVLPIHRLESLESTDAGATLKVAGLSLR